MEEKGTKKRKTTKERNTCTQTELDRDRLRYKDTHVERHTQRAQERETEKIETDIQRQRGTQRERESMHARE